MFKKILKYIFILWLVVTIFGAPFYWPYVRMLWVFNPIVSGPDYAEPSTVAEARLQDLDYLGTFTKYDRAFSEEELAAFEAARSSLIAHAETLSEADFYLGIAEAVALAGNGHTNLSSRPQYTQFNTVGVRFYSFADGVYITTVRPDLAPLLGQRVIQINARPVEEVISHMGKYKGGNTAWKRLAAPMLMESPELMTAAGLGEDSHSLKIEVQAADGTVTEHILQGQRAEDPEAVPYRRAWHSLSPFESASHGEDWLHVLDTVGPDIPKYMQDPAELLAYSLDSERYYLRSLGGFVAGDLSIGDAYKQMTETLEPGSLEVLVIDFRLNDGGNYLKSIGFAKSAAQYLKPEGKLYILTGPNTFSAGIVTVAMLKYYAQGRAQLIGEPIGDFEQFWAERGTHFLLPNSGYYVYYATGYHDWEAGCKGQPYCFTMNERHEVPAGSLAPDLLLSPTFEAYRNGQDVVLEWVQDSSN